MGDADEFARRKPGHLEDADSAREGLADAFHEVVGLGAGEDDFAVLVLSVDDELRRLEQRGDPLHFVDDERQAVRFEEQQRVVFCTGGFDGVFQGHVRERVFQAVIQDGGLADLAGSCDEYHLELLQCLLYRCLDFAVNIHE